MANFTQIEEEIISGKPISVPQFLKEWLAKPKQNYINGKWAPTAETFSSINPSTEEKLATIHAAGKLEVDLAVKSAREAFERGEWSRKTLLERAAVVQKIGELVLEHRAPLALLESLDTGKPIRESFEGDILRASQNFQFFANFAQEEKTTEYKNGTDVHQVLREPLGVALLITPWNLPLYLETWKIAPALLMGNSVILKPSELTPLTATYLAELIESVGLPTGVFQLLHGFGENACGEFLTRHPGVDAISFTGETGTGRAIMKCAASGPTKVSFELGGKGANIVFEDADLKFAATESARAAFRNQGEICLALPRLFIQKSVYSKFVELFLENVQQIKVGNPLDYSTTMGALISKEHFEKVESYIRRVEPPAKFLVGGKRPQSLSKGYYLEPTVVEGLSHTHPISCEEVFGPVVSLYSFETEEEVVRLANQTQYGLSASLWTTSRERVARLTPEIRAGLLWINTWFVRDLRVAFGGQKKSGIGREGGKYSLDFFSELKSVCIRGLNE